METVKDRRGEIGADLERRVMHRVFWPALGILIGVGLINATTLLTEAQRDRTPIDTATPWILEFSSVTMLVLVVPLIALFVRVAPPLPSRWLVALPLYLGISLVFSGLHILGMVGLRKLAFWLLWGRNYVFFDAPLTDLVYEYRKDLLPFAVIVVVCHLARRLEENRQQVMTAKAETSSPERLTLKLGSRTIWLDAASFQWANAAGNYVEVCAGSTTHLARMPLSALETLLKQAGIAAIRVHRSRIVNRDRVSEILPTRDGDFVVRLLDGTQIRGSRRYRDILADG